MSETTPNGDPVAAANPWDEVIVEGPSGIRVAGTRITIWDIYYYQLLDWDQSSIALLLGLSSRQVLAAFAYIKANKDEVHRVHLQIEERIARGHPPEVQAKLDKIHAEFAPLWEARRAAAKENGDERNRGGR
jgi:hypothetical protein